MRIDLPIDARPIKASYLGTQQLYGAIVRLFSNISLEADAVSLHPPQSPAKAIDVGDDPGTHPFFASILGIECGQTVQTGRMVTLKPWGCYFLNKMCVQYI